MDLSNNTYEHSSMWDIFLDCLITPRSIACAMGFRAEKSPSYPDERRSKCSLIGKRVNTDGLKNQNSKGLGYRMRNTVSCDLRDNCPVLIRKFPLKVIVLIQLWKPIVDRLSTEYFVPFGALVPLFQNANPKKFELLLNGLVRKGFLEREGFPTLAKYPHVSVIIPVRNRPQEITACLQSLTRLNYPSEQLEIIVVDDASDDSTPDEVSKFPVRLIILKKNKQASFCRNLAAKRAKGGILAFIDSDCLADPFWLKELVPVFGDESVGAVGGMVDSCFKDSPLDRYEKVKSSLKIGTCFKSSREDSLSFYVPSCNLLVRRDVFLRLSGFRENLNVGEDVDFCWRLQDEGHYVEYAPIGKVYHKHRNKLRSFCSRRFDYGTSESILQKFHTKRIKQLIFPAAGSLFWGVAVLSMLLEYYPLLGLCGLVVLFDSSKKFFKIRRNDISIRFSSMIWTVLRIYLAFFYHCCAFISRYYLFLLILVLPFLPLASIIVLFMHALTGIMEYFTRKPKLNVFTFLFYFSCEQISYQLGVWWGCLRRFHFSAVNPKIVLKRR